jgi:dTDP-4-dehydrorhamnose reductase
LVHPLKTLVIGAKGFLGRHFHTFYPECLGTHHVLAPGFETLDLFHPHLDWLKEHYPFAIIAGGIVNPKKCNEESYLCNVEGPLLLGKLLVERGTLPIFFSSDYVFDGTQPFYTSASLHSPLNLYGKQKAELEVRLLQELQGNCLIIRLSKVYGTTKGDGTLFDEMTATLVQKKPLFAAHDQIFAPMSVEEVVQGVAELQKKRARGLFQFAGPLSASRYEMASYLAQDLGREELVKRISLDDLNDGIVRPKCTYLHSTVFAAPWKEGINKMVREYARERDLGSNG